MGARGPKPGSGGRPRKVNAPRADGYVKATVGPAGKGTQSYQHRKVVGLKPGNPTTVDHIKPVSKGGSNAPSNLRRMSQAANTARANRGRKGTK